MKFSVKGWSSGKARVGVLQLGNCPSPIETPALLLSTRKGLPVFISPDLLPSLPSPDSHLLQFSPLHFLDGPSPKTISKIGGLQNLIGLHEHGLIAVARDSIYTLPVADSANKLGPSFETTCGRCLMKPVDYIDIISSLGPDLWASLADEVPSWASNKRNRVSVDRTVKWLDECIVLGSTKRGGSNILGAIVGGSSVDERRRCAEEVVKRNVPGYWLGGFGLGESLNERPGLLNAVVDVLPEESPRLVCGLGLPEEVLQGVDAGIDLFDSAYIHHLTLGGFALTFQLDVIAPEVSDLRGNDREVDMTKINLRATIYRKDASPIVERCRCYTCQNHTRAYINHLLNVHEMLAQILLEVHNTHHYLGFFWSIREAIKAGKFQLFRQKFVESTRIHVADRACDVSNHDDNGIDNGKKHQGRDS